MNKSQIEQNFKTSEFKHIIDKLESEEKYMVISMEDIDDEI